MLSQYLKSSEGKNPSDYLTIIDFLRKNNINTKYQSNQEMPVDESPKTIKKQPKNGLSHFSTLKPAEESLNSGESSPLKRSSLEYSAQNLIRKRNSQILKNLGRNSVLSPFEIKNISKSKTKGPRNWLENRENCEAKSPKENENEYEPSSVFSNDKSVEKGKVCEYKGFLTSDTNDKSSKKRKNSLDLSEKNPIKIQALALSREVELQNSGCESMISELDELENRTPRPKATRVDVIILAVKISGKNNFTEIIKENHIKKSNFHQSFSEFISSSDMGSIAECLNVTQLGKTKLKYCN